MTTKIKKWLATDGTAEVEIIASTAEEAAKKYVYRGDWGDSSETQWIDVLVKLLDSEEDGEWITIALDPEEPDCEDGYDHDWQSPHELLGGIPENPGVQGNGGGVIVTEVCANCGKYCVTNTWAERPDTGEQGLESVEYRDADDESRAWSLAGIREELSELIVEAMDISYGIYQDADRIRDEINDREHTRSEAAELLSDLRERLDEARSNPSD